jgi:PAS domain S-box-containing protein
MPSHPRVTILNVNDDDANRYAVSRMLRKAGFEVWEASTGEDALRRVTGGPDLVILDVKLPDISGMEVCRRIKADPATARTIVLHLSAISAHGSDRLQGLEGGADGYLTQPVTASELIANVKALLRIRQAEDLARVAARQWETTFDAIGDGVCLLGRDGSVLRCNRATTEILGKTFRELIGRPLGEVALDVMAPAEAALLDRLGAAVATGGSGVGTPASRESLEVRIGERWFQANADPVIDDRGGATGSVLILADITERKLLEAALRRHAEELAEAAHRKDEFLAMLSHELRNPLGPIRNALHLLRLRGSDPASIQRMREVVERQIRHMTRLVDDLLDVSRITRGKILLRYVRLDLARLARDTAEDHRLTVEEAGLTLALELPEAPIWVVGDPTRIAQMLDNLLHNAVKFTDAGGTITVRVSAEPEECQAVVSVTDTGVGIAPEMLPRVFGIFEQADSSLDRSRGGLGLGLALVKGLVQMHGGEVRAESEGPGRGARFTLWLPLEQAGASEGDASVPREKSARVLVVEDNRDAAETLRELMDLLGHEVEVAYSGPEGLAAARRFRPDVVLCDLGLPGMDGYALAAELRGSPETAHARLIAVSGYGQMEDRIRAREAGFDLHLTKPVDPERLSRLLAAWEAHGDPLVAETLAMGAYDRESRRSSPQGHRDREIPPRTR